MKSDGSAVRKKEGVCEMEEALVQDKAGGQGRKFHESINQ